MDPPSGHDGDTAQPPLALDLHYLLTVYGAGSDELLAHRILGRAMRVLHDHSVLDRQEIATALAGNDLGDQLERVRISHEPLTLDEMSKLWGSFQKEYRTSTAYTVSVVLIDSDRASRTPVPVLTRGEGDVRTTNEIPLAVAPELVTIAPTPAPRDGTGAVTLTATVRPNVLSAQAA